MITEGAGYRSESPEEFELFIRDMSWVHFIGMVLPPRVGVQQCMSTLEYGHYKPDTDRNKLFLLRMFNWEGTVWAMCSIPAQEYHLMERVATDSGLRIVRGSPFMITGDSIKTFPVQGPHVYTFENARGHVAYSNDRSKIQAAIAEEKELVAHVTGIKKSN